MEPWTTPWTEFSNNELNNSQVLWLSSESYYGTFKLGDLNGDKMMDICARSPLGMKCSLSNGSLFTPSRVWKTNDFTDTYGWTDTRYSGTINLVDVNGDGRVDIMARNSAGIEMGFAP